MDRKEIGTEIFFYLVCLVVSMMLFYGALKPELEIEANTNLRGFGDNYITQSVNESKKGVTR